MAEVSTPEPPPAPPVVEVEDVQNLENENNENSALLEENEEGAQSGMEVDGEGISGTQTEPVSDSKTEEQGVSLPGGEAEVASTENITEETEVKNEAPETVQVGGEVKEESCPEEADSYMVLEEADGDDAESDLEDESLSENDRLRKANQQLSERLAVLEEFIEVEFSDKFGKFIKKREHLVEVMGFGGSKSGDVPTISGKRSAKSVELVGLLKLVNDQAKTTNGRRRGKTGATPLSSPTKGPPKSTPAQGATPTPSAAKKPDGTATATTTDKPKRCHRCRSIGHLKRDCPLPLDIRSDRKIILRKEQKQRSRAEDSTYPQLKQLKDKRRRLTRAVNRERQRTTRNSNGRL